MAKTKRKSERTLLLELPALLTDEGERIYLCLGPNVWAKGKTAFEAWKNAKELVSPHARWRWIMYDVQADATITEMGDIYYTPHEGVTPYRELGRFEGSRA